ncbi:hypothetical protein [Segatella hominis]|jgi:hypothetical protein|uniref:Uncharacterized protein n=1 Tax=Segatella hominis TaxID=2518605 RepID=A0A4Y8VB03_9BACT|nr:hypothetical protein [Segatella hominis]TFH78078.1 hypothetical protein EXN75_11920 [Segatella hominis]
MSTTISCRVDTKPMAEELHSVSNHVKGTTAAVTTMQAAVIAAENSGANKVCSNVNRGFFTLMCSQISQKIASKHSRVEALLMHLGQQKRILMGIKNNMEREYGRICERYHRIFTSINKELEQRIRQIDQPVFELVNKNMVTASNRMNALTGWAANSQIEGLTDSQRILMSKMKYNAQYALEQSADFLAQIGKQRVLTNQILISNVQGNEDKTCQIPVIICESISDTASIPRTEVWTPDDLSSANASQINNVIREKDMEWKDEKWSVQVDEEFNRLVDSSNASQRVKQMIQKLYTTAESKTL